MEIVRTGRFCLFLTPIPGLNIVDTIHLDERNIEDAVSEVRALLRERGRFQAAWVVSPSSKPTDLKPRLLALGMTPFEHAPFEPSFTAMAIVSPPNREAPGDVDVREASTHDDMDAFSDVEQEALGITADEWRPMREMRHLAFDLQQQGRFPVCFFLALHRGEPVGAALGSLLDSGINLSGGTVVPEARGIGVYTALVNARWAAAVERDTPALTVQAGKMSRPILERLGFTPLATSMNFCDQFA